MSEHLLDLQPQTLAERWFTFGLRYAMTKHWAAFYLAFGIAFVGLHVVSRSEAEPVGFLFVLGAFFLAGAMVHFERNGAYTLLKRQQEEIDRLKEACTTNTST
jgi:hypothetical protein